MRIGVFVDAYEPHTSGVTTSVNMLKMTLENMGHTVYIVTANLVNNKFIYDEENRIIWLPGIKLGLYDFKLTSFYSPRAMKISSLVVSCVILMILPLSFLASFSMSFWTLLNSSSVYSTLEPLAFTLLRYSS